MLDFYYWSLPLQLVCPIIWIPSSKSSNYENTKVINYELSIFWNYFMGLLLICNDLWLSMYLLSLVYSHILLSLRGENTFNPPQIVVTSLIFLQLICLVTYGHILDFCLFYIYLTIFRINLINFFFKSNKQWRTWVYGVYLWQNNMYYHKIWKFVYIFQN